LRKMEIKTLEPVHVLCTEVTTTLKEIKAYVGSTPADLYAEAAQCGLTPAGPQHWVYTGMTTNDPDHEFHLLIGLPVTGGGQSEQYQQKELPVFKCATMIHNGSWNDLGFTYKQLFGALIQQGFIPTGTCREVYLVVDMENPQNNITEVQAGIK
jgi:effector-binding domain-containing protein